MTRHQSQAPSPGNTGRIVRRLLKSLKDHPQNARRHTKRQLRKLADVMARIGFVGVIVVNRDGVILAGHARRAAALMAGIAEADCHVVDHLTPAEELAFLAADNRLALDATWDMPMLNEQLLQIQELDGTFDLKLTGFDEHELDSIMQVQPIDQVSPQDDALPEPVDGPTVIKVGDVVEMGPHRLICGDSRSHETFVLLMGQEFAAIVIADAPYNLEMSAIGGSGQIQHHDFPMGMGEMDSPAFRTFLSTVMAHCVTFSVDGSMHFHFMDWRHLEEMLAAGRENYPELKNLIVWNKGVGGMGSFYRSAHELIFAFRSGKAAAINTFGLGQHGRYRTNVWNYRGNNTGSAGRLEELAIHPTAKPVQMLADALLDCSRRGSIVLDPYGGSGSTLIAAEKTGRRGRLIELDPVYADRIVRRWQDFARDEAVFADTGETFDERERHLKQKREEFARLLVRPGRVPTSRIVDFSQEIRP